MKNAFVVLSLVLGTSATHAATFTVCASGCTYKTISAAYSAASCGDRIQVNINGGINESPNVGLNKKCTSASPITIAAGAGYSPRIDPSTTEWVDAVVISGSYNVWDGIGVYDVPHGNGILLSGDHNTVKNSLLDRISYNDWPAGQGAAGIRLTGSSNVVQGNTVLDTDHGGIEIDGVSYTPQYNQILNNKIKTAYGHGVWIGGTGARYNLVDGNDISDCGSRCVGPGCASKNAIEISGGRNNSIRRNVIHDIYNRAMEVSSYSDVTDNTINNWVYNNTFYNITTRPTDASTAFWVVVSTSAGTRTTANNKFYNNIADKVAQRINTDVYSMRLAFALYNATENDAGTTQSELIANDWNGNVLVGNIIRPYYSGAYQPSAPQAITYVSANGSYHPIWTVPAVNGVGSMSRNITSDPLFMWTDTAQPNWWHLRSSSPAIDAGVVVNDPNAATGGWAQLTYNGSAPDIGAFESGSTGPQLSAPTNLRIVQ